MSIEAVEDDLGRAEWTDGEGSPLRDMEGIDWLEAVMDHPNIAEELEPSVLAEIGDRVVQEYKVDRQSRAEYEERLEKAMKLAMQVEEAKNYPWPKASNVKFPLMVKAAIHFGANAYPAIVPDGDVVKGRVIGDDKGQPEIDRQTGQPQMQQVGQDPESGEPIMDVVWKVEPGAKRQRADRVAKHMSWQLIEEITEWEEETDKLLHILPIVGCLFRKTYYNVDEARNVSELCTPKDLVVNYTARSLDAAPRVTHELDRLPHEIIENKRAGIYLDVELGEPSRENANDEDAPHLFLEQHRRWDLDGDGYTEPYVVTVHKETRQVVRIIARFDEQSIVTSKDGEVLKIIPIQYFTKYGFVPSPDGGFYDMGFGTMLYPLNEVVNTTVNQMIDAGTVQNAGGGLISGGVGLSGKVKFTLGEYKVVKGVSGPMRDAIYRYEHPGPSQTLFALLGLLIDAAEDLASVKDIMTGEAPPAGMTATLGLALIERGMKVFTAIYKRIHRSLKQEMKKLYRLNAINLPEEVYIAVLDDSMAIGQADYNTTDFDIVPVSDPTIVTDMQRLGRAEFLMQFINDPDVDSLKIKRRVMEAATIDDIDDLLITERQPDPALVAAIDKQELEVGKLELKETEAGLKARKLDLDARETALKERLADADVDLKSAQTIKTLEEADEVGEENGPN